MLIQLLTQINLKRAIQGPAFLMPKHHALRFFLQMEQVHFPTQTSMVALFSLFDHRQIGLQLFITGPACAVDALQHLIITVSAPIGSRQFGELKGFSQFTRRGQMRAST